MNPKMCFMCNREPAREEGKHMCSNCYNHWRKIWDWQNESEKDGMICPYCDYEFDDSEKEYGEGTMDITCPSCDKKFEVETNCLWFWKSRKRESDFDEEEVEE